MRALCWGLAVALVALGGSGLADETKLKLEELPKVVRAAVDKRFPKAELSDASKEVVDGKTFFEVSLKHKGAHVDVTLTPDGAITEIETTIDAKTLPGAVTKGLFAKYPKARIEKAETIVKPKDGKEHLEAYEVIIAMPDKKKWEVVLTPEGKITKEEDKTNEKE